MVMGDTLSPPHSGVFETFVCVREGPGNFAFCSLQAEEPLRFRPQIVVAAYLEYYSPNHL